MILYAMASTAIEPVRAQSRSQGYSEAERAYQTGLSPRQRIFVQVLLTGAGYWNAVPNENFNGRLFRAIQTFQQENGFVSNAIFNEAQLDRLFSIAGPKFDQWGFSKVQHPSRRVGIWVPLGLGLRAVRNEFGLQYTDPQDRLRLDFTTVPNVAIAANYAAVLTNIVQEGAKIHFRIMKDGWFAVSATTLDGTDYYLRYHQDGSNVTGFTLSWINKNGNISGERIAVLTSGSLWSHMTGAMFLDPTQLSSKAETARSASPTAPSTSAAAEPRPEQNRKVNVGSGTGFFVGRDGAILTNAHVVDNCSTVTVVPDGSGPVPARVTATDRTNDLALLKTDYTPKKVANLRIGIRLGEPIAAFGFPLSGVLASNGNFTLGNITALAGLGDDTRHMQISAPVQPGNSGGPLLDNKGDVVGIVTYKLNALKTAAASGDIPQNVNFAVKASAAATFLESNRVVAEPGAGSAVLQPADLADHAKAMSAFVQCR
jgi:S1-C subfamily serine protease